MDPNGNFINKLNKHGRSALFLTGNIMFTAGSLVLVLSGMNWHNVVITLGMLLLPVTCFWMMFATCKTYENGEKITCALSRFKTAAVVAFIFACLAGLPFLFLGLLFAPFNSATSIAMAILFLLPAVIILIIATGYFLGIKKIIKGIEHNVMFDAFKPLPGIKTVTVFTCTIVIFQILRLSFGDNPSFIPPLIFTVCNVIGTVGAVICLVVLNKFNNMV